MSSPNRPTHIRLTSHPEPNAATARFPIRWGAGTPKERGPIIGSVTTPADRNVIGAHGGSYSLYRALAISARALNPLARPDLHNTHPTTEIGPHPQWSERGRIVSLDPWGHLVGQAFADEIAQGVDIRPTIAITKARLNMPEILTAMGARRLKADGGVLHASGDISVTKIAVDPVWYLPASPNASAARGRAAAHALRADGGMFPELVTRPDMSVFLPPIGNTTVYVVGEVSALDDPKRTIACRVHDECNGSDVFGSDICTCRPYLVHGIEECVREAQAGGVGVIAYNRKEAVRSARSPSSSSTTRASARKAATAPPPTSNARNASPACRTRGSSSHAGRPSLARHPPHRPAHVHVEHEIRRHHGLRHRGGGTGADPAGARAAGRAGGDRGEESRRYYTPEGAPDASALGASRGGAWRSSDACLALPGRRPPRNGGRAAVIRPAFRRRTCVAFRSA